MLKEIWEQPRAIRDTCSERVWLDGGDVILPEIGLGRDALAEMRRVAMVACGTSWHAALLGKYLFERLCRVPVEVDIASEFRYRPPVAERDTLTVVLSQSGETADTLGAARQARSAGSPVLSICNVVGSTLAREGDGVLYTR